MGDASGLDPEQSQVIKELSESPKLNGPSAILKDFLNGGSTTRVIINLRKPAYANQLRNFANMAVRQQLQEAVRESHDNLIDTLDLQEIRITNKFTYIFGFSSEVTLKGLQDLVDNSAVASIEEDRILHAQLAQGIPLMKASTPRASYNGMGLSVAICDTGIDYTHPMLGGGGFPNSKVIGGYDAGDNDADPMDQQGHGTAVAGIVAGTLGTVGNYIGGVAYNAKLYAVKVTTGSGGTASESDMIEGWEWAITHQNDDPSNPIKVINTSFGTGRYNSTCDGTSTAMTTAAANAVAAGITLFVASGNDGYCDSIGFPACISHVISVGAVYDANLGRHPPTGFVGCIKNGSCVGTPGPPCAEKYYVDDPANEDQVPTFSNTASILKILAPSYWATTPKLGGGYWDTPNGFGGTSAATPYAAGAAAVLQSAAKAITGSYLTPAQVRSKLVGTGDLITDSKAGITKPRVNLGAAVNSLNGGSQTSNWLGHTTEWDSAANWSKGSIPGSSTNVIIPPSPSGGKFPIIDISDAVAQKVTLEGGKITVQAGKLTLGGTPSAQPNISYSGSNPYDYGEIQTGSSSNHAFTIQNTGSATLSISGAPVSGTGFSVVGSVPSSISAGGNATITVRFVPSSVGNFTGTLSINSNDPDTPTLSIGLAGKGKSVSQKTSIVFYNLLTCGGKSFAATLTIDGQALTSTSGISSVCKQSDCGKSLAWSLYANPGGCGTITGQGSIALDCNCIYEFVLTLSGGNPAIGFVKTCPGDCTDVTSASTESMESLGSVVLKRDANSSALTVYNPFISE